MSLRRSLFRSAACAALIAVLAIYLAPGGAAAQSLQGRVVLQGAGVEQVRVELHRVTRDSSGVVSHTPTGAGGEFSIALPPVDSAGFTVFFATADYLGVRYFGAPIHPGQPPAGDYSIEVYDTVASAAASAAVRVPRRDVVLLPQPDGGWEVNEILQVENPGSQTLVSMGGKPTWEFRIPPGAVAFELGEGEISASEIARMEDRVLLLLPLVPGRREIFLRYLLPASEHELRVPLDTPTEALNLYVQQPSPPLWVEGLQSRELIQAEGERFLHFEGTQLDASSPIIIAWEGPASPPLDPTTAAIAAVVIFLAVGIGAALWRRGPSSGPGAPSENASARADEEAPQMVG
ncbi:hypothetical protein BH23GEM3_BH23GEM3_11820 [soil metagenome]|nr:carboxypeptidase regulatory-like domain-containing protein [Gemmatimonadota bacterium]